MSVVNKMTVTTAADILYAFDRTYKLANWRFVNKIGQEASQRTIDLVREAQATLDEHR